MCQHLQIGHPVPLPVFQVYLDLKIFLTNVGYWETLTLDCTKIFKLVFSIKYILIPILEKTAVRAYQERRRFVLDQPEPGGRMCPELRETRVCRHLPQCVSYRWDMSPWSRCIFPHSYEKCGSGYRARGEQIEQISDGSICT